MEFKDQQLNAIIERGQKVNTVIEQLENLKKDAKNDEVRALSAAFLAFVIAVREVVVFRA